MAISNANASAAAKAGEVDLVITRVFDAPRSLVFEAWTDSKHVASWWGPKDFTITSCTVEFRPGGAWRTCMRSPQGVDHWASGVYREIVAPERLVFTFAWDAGQEQQSRDTTITVNFEELDGKTKLIFHQAFFDSVPDRDSHREGWNECFDRLGAYLAIR